MSLTQIGTIMGSSLRRKFSDDLETKDTFSTPSGNWNAADASTYCEYL
jgi:hypothetical protein